MTVLGGLAGSMCFVVPIALVIVLVVVASRAAERRRQQRMASIAWWAQQREFEYRPADPALAARFAGPPFGIGRDRRATNVVLGRYEGRPFTAFDYAYTTTSTSTNADGMMQSRTTVHPYGVVAVNLGVTAPPLAVGPSSTMKRFWDTFTNRDVAVGDPAFDHDFLVHCSSPEFARDVLTPDVIALQRQAPALSWRFVGDSMLVIRPGAQQPAEVEGKLQFMDALLDRIPPYVWDRLRGQAR